MELIETAPIATAVLPLATFRDHLRLGTGFGDDTLQDGVLETCLRAAIARVEGHCGKAVLARPYRLTLGEWRDLSRLVLPLAPVAAVTRLAIFDRSGAETLIAPAQYRLIRDDHRPLLISSGYNLPQIPLTGRAEIDFDAGFAGWAVVPGDMAQAVLLLAAGIYENRDGQAGGGMPVLVSGLLARFRVLRIGGGFSA
jgi:uncharacterized phiE125 gp8 family phage protein